MKILIATDKFKHSLTSFQACNAIEAGFKKASSKFVLTKLPLSDGGDGMAAVIAHYIEAQTISVPVCDPLFREVKASYLLSTDRQIAFIEMAAASGLHLLSPAEYNCAVTSSFGTGQLIRHAIEQGVKKIVLGIGGSATNDGGIGMAAALGYRLLDGEGKELKPVGEQLIHIQSIVAPGKNMLEEIMVEVACDVDNYLTGDGGAARLYAPQKGADALMVEQLEKGMLHFAEVVHQRLGIDLLAVKGGGAAGGMGAGCVAFLNAQLRKGADMILQWAKAEQHVQQADLIITGEGKIDAQTLYGKLVNSIAALSKQHGKPVIVFCGMTDVSSEVLENMGIISVFSIVDKPMMLEDACSNAASLLQEKAYQVAKLLKAITRI